MASFIGTTTPCTVATPFNSGIRETDATDRITGIIFSDQAGTIYIEQSIDSTNWDMSTSYPVVANDGTGFSEELVAPYYRIRFVPSSDTTVLRIGARATSAGAR